MCAFVSLEGDDAEMGDPEVHLVPLLILQQEIATGKYSAFASHATGGPSPSTDDPNVHTNDMQSHDRTIAHA